jgi:hypothetical protein
MKSKLSTLIYASSFFPVFFLLTLFGQNTFANSGKIIISEFMAINNNTLQDDDGDYSDWIELHNPGTENVNLQNWYLTDDKSNLYKWEFPAIILGPDEYIVVFASDKNRKKITADLHTNFKLSGSGEYLALIEPDMKTISYSFGNSYPAQEKDVSYGVLNGIHVFFESPTPGNINSQSNKPVSPVFSHKRNYYTDTIEVTLQSPYPDSEIYYTTDGSFPTTEMGILYTNAIEIYETTPLSAIIVKDGVASEIISHTYWFVNDIVNQSQQQQGYPDTWSKFVYIDENAPADYEMDPEICQSTEYKNLLNDAFLSIPSINIVTEKDYIFSHEIDSKTGGIYIYTGKTGYGSKGIDWERPASVEYYDPQNSSNFQVNCIIQLHGGNSRVPGNSPKHSFRLEFKSDYGVSKLNFNLFDDDRNPVNEFNSLVLRSGYNYSWVKNSTEQNVNADYLRDPFSKNTQIDMGHYSAHSKFVHLYINGLYWGVYTLSEKITDDFMETYMNGDEEDWDVVKDHNGTTDGTRTAWNELLSFAKKGLSLDANYQRLLGNNANGSPNSDYKKLLDPVNFTDYILLNFYIGNKDWDGNNWLAARNRVDTKYGFRMFVWDAETSMLNINENITSLNDGEPTTLFNLLLENDEYKMLVADRIHKHFFNNGALTPPATIERYTRLANELDLAIICESARWGDYRRDVHNVDNRAELYTRNDHWLVEVEDQLNNYFPYRTEKVFNQLKGKGLYPSLDAPLFSNYGATVEGNIDFSMENPNNTGTIYFTTDNSDPRLIDGNIATNAFTYHGNPMLIIGQGTIKARIFDGYTWSALTEAEFNSDNQTDFIVSNNNLAKFNVSCFPNPATSYVNFLFDMPQPGNVNISIHSTDGRLIKNIFTDNQKEGTRKIQWFTDNIPNGIYFYQIKANSLHKSGKIIIKK